MSIKDKIQELENQLAELKKEVQQQEETKGVWPQKGDEYYVVNSGGGVISVFWDNDSYDCGALSIGNAYKTKEEAESEVFTRNVIQQLRSTEGCRPFVVKNENHYICFSTDGSEAERDLSYYYCNGVFSLYWDTEEDISAAINTVGKENILKAIKWQAMREIVVQ